MECSLRNGAYWRGLLLSAFLAAPGAALAADNGFYLGLASSDVSSDYDLGPARRRRRGRRSRLQRRSSASGRSTRSRSRRTTSISAKTRVPLSLACVTTPCPTEATIDSQAVSVSAVGLLALPLVDLYARVGYARWESELSPFVAEKREGSDPTYGAGAQMRLGSFALRLEYERFDFDDDSADLVSIGFTYTFL